MGFLLLGEILGWGLQIIVEKIKKGLCFWKIYSNIGMILGESLLCCPEVNMQAGLCGEQSLQKRQVVEVRGESPVAKASARLSARRAGATGWRPRGM